ncbi:hypothetical protein FRC04_005852 [Tulasnella sp. 424]|nr:hypothetical protein FRC04_005852 [Tulasnella sp. 424]KAG8975997.1 hypothetical protein FRC05_004627 [Tulasnella sp. 425]
MSASPGDASDGFKTTNISARGILDALSPRLRINPDVVQPTGDPGWHGGSSEVIVAHLIPEGDKSVTENLDTKVVVKKLYFIMGNNRERLLNAFANEVLILSELSHPNIIELVGFVEDEKKDIAWMVLPWEENGNMRDFVLSRELEIPHRLSLVSGIMENGPTTSPDTVNGLQQIKDVMSGIEYLHTRQPPICHGDLKSLNILIDSENCAVLTDFGSARVRKAHAIQSTEATRLVQEPATESASSEGNQTSPEVQYCAATATLTLTGPQYTLRWAAPEVLLESNIDLPSDIWAFAWICWEPSSVPPKLSGGAASGRRSVDLLCQLGEMHRKQGRLEEALLLFQEAVGTARLPDQSRELGAALLGVGDIHRARSNYLEAESNYSEALGIYNQIDGAKGPRANALDRLAEVYRAQEKFLEAQECYSQALEIYTELGVDAGRANVLDGLGDLYMLQCRYTEARDSYAQVLDICVVVGDELGRANALCGMGDVHLALSEPSEAETHYTEALGVYKSIGDELGRTNILLSMASIHNSRSETSKAEECYTEALEVSTRVGYELGKGTALLSLGRIFVARSDREKARTCFMQAQDVHAKIGNERGEELARFLLERVEDAPRRPGSPLVRLELSPLGWQPEDRPEEPPLEVKQWRLFDLGISTVGLLFRSLDRLMPFLFPLPPYS